MDLFDCQILLLLALTFYESPYYFFQIWEVIHVAFLEYHFPHLFDEFCVFGVVDGAFGGVHATDVHLEETLDLLLQTCGLPHDEDVRQLDEDQDNFRLAHLPLPKAGHGYDA